MWWRSSAERFTAEKALRIGLIHEIVATPEALGEAAERLLKNILECGPNAVAVAKKLGAAGVINSREQDPAKVMQELTGGEGADLVIDGGMTAGIGNPDILARTITLYTDVGAFQRALGIPSSEEVHVFVVEPSGAILARASGEPEVGWGLVAPALDPTGRTA